MFRIFGLTICTNKDIQELTSQPGIVIDVEVWKTDVRKKLQEQYELFGMRLWELGAIDDPEPPTKPQSGSKGDKV